MLGRYMAGSSMISTFTDAPIFQQDIADVFLSFPAWLLAANIVVDFLTYKLARVICRRELELAIALSNTCLWNTVRR